MKSDKYINLAVCNVIVRCSYNIHEDAILSHEFCLILVTLQVQREVQISEFHAEQKTKKK